MRKVNLLKQARIDRVQTLPFSNWMDIPNIVMCMPNGTKVDRLHFCYKMPGSTVPDSICICNLRRKDKSKKDCDFSTNAPVDAEQHLG